MKTLLKNAWLLTMDDGYTDIRNGWLLTEGSRIAALGGGPEPEGADEVIDCGGGLLIPGFVNTHCHASMIPFRTMGDDCPDRLTRFLFPLEQEAWTEELTWLGARYAAAEMLLSGITTAADMYYYEDRVAQAFAEMGLRSFPGETVICQRAPGSDTPEEALALSGGKLSALLSPWSPPWQWKTPPLARRNDAAAYGGQEAGTAAEPSRCNGGRLKPEYYPAWARYVVKYLEAYLAEGIPVTMLSVQNEAAAATPWDSCVWTGEEEKTFLKLEKLSGATR